MVGERPKLTASEIEAMLRAALQKLPSLRGTKSEGFVRTATSISALRRQPEGRRSREARQRTSKPTKPAGGNTMRRFMVHLVTEVEFEDGDEASDKTVQNYQKQLSETVRNAVQGLLLRTVKGARIESVSVAEIRTEL